MTGTKFPWPWLYFILTANAVKIGNTADPAKRLCGLKGGTPYPVRFLALFADLGHREKECHERLAHLRLQGEWFRYTAEVDQLVAELASEPLDMAIAHCAATG